MANDAAFAAYAAAEEYLAMLTASKERAERASADAAAAVKAAFDAAIDAVSASADALAAGGLEEAQEHVRRAASREKEATRARSRFLNAETDMSRSLDAARRLTGREVAKAAEYAFGE